MATKTTTTASVCIVESLNFLDEETRKEGEIISRTLRLSGKKPHYSYIRTRDEFEALVKEFGDSDYRYLHVSCHGNTNEFYLTTEMIPAEEFVGILAPHMKGRRLFLSTCLAANDTFAKEFLKQSGCWSVLGPAGTIRFDDAAIFWSAFYHHRFKQKSESMNRKDVMETATLCANMIGEQFRFYYLDDDDKVRTKLLGKPPAPDE
jgi:hypothetical protein